MVSYYNTERDALKLTEGSVINKINSKNKGFLNESKTKETQASPLNNIEIDKKEKEKNLKQENNFEDKVVGINEEIAEKELIVKEVIFFCAFNQTFTKIRNYTTKEILNLLQEFQKDNFVILQIDNDPKLQEELAKINFKNEFEVYISQLNTLTVDYCFSPVDEYLYFNLSVVNNIKAENIEKKLIQIIVHKSGIYINNKDNCSDILNIFVNKFSFKELGRREFFKLAYKVKTKEESVVNDFKIKSVIQNEFSKNKKQGKSKGKKKRRNSFNNLNIPSKYTTDKLKDISLKDDSRQLTRFKSNEPGQRSSKVSENASKSMKIYDSATKEKANDIISNFDIKVRLIDSEGNIAENSPNKFNERRNSTMKKFKTAKNDKESNNIKAVQLDEPFTKLEIAGKRIHTTEHFTNNLKIDTGTGNDDDDNNDYNNSIENDSKNKHNINDFTLNNSTKSNRNDTDKSKTINDINEEHETDTITEESVVSNKSNMGSLTERSQTDEVSESNSSSEKSKNETNSEPRSVQDKVDNEKETPMSIYTKTESINSKNSNFNKTFSKIKKDNANEEKNKGFFFNFQTEHTVDSNGNRITSNEAEANNNQLLVSPYNMDFFNEANNPDLIRNFNSAFEEANKSKTLATSYEKVLREGDEEELENKLKAVNLKKARKSRRSSKLSRSSSSKGKHVEKKTKTLQKSKFHDKAKKEGLSVNFKEVENKLSSKAKKSHIRNTSKEIINKGELKHFTTNFISPSTNTFKRTQTLNKKKSKLNEQLHQVDENDFSFEENNSNFEDQRNDDTETKKEIEDIIIQNHIRKSTNKSFHQTKISRESNKMKNIESNDEKGNLNAKRKMSHLSSRSNNTNDTLKEFLTVSNFSTDDLIYWILINSLEKLEAFGNNLVEEAYLLKDMYMKISEDERSDFFRRIHSLEISTQVIFQEVVIKKKFLKYSKSQFKNYNKVSNNFYFKSSFNFFIELMISKVTQLEIVIDKLQSIVRMIKENYLITIEDNTHMQNIKLNMVMKVLAIITTIYAPFDIVAALFGMNVPIPFEHSESLWPFFGIIGFLILIFIIQLVLFKRLGWF